MGLASETEAANKDLSFVEFNGMEASAEKLSEVDACPFVSAQVLLSWALVGF